MEHVDKALVKNWVGERLSYEKISERLKDVYPNISRGLSARSVRRYCKKLGITRQNDEEIDHVVGVASKEVKLYPLIIL